MTQPAPSHVPALLSVRTWVYQLQNLNLNAMAATGFDAAVIDYSQDGTDAGAFTASQIAALHESGKLVLAYMDIGEVESFRFYEPAFSQNNPQLLGPQNVGSFDGGTLVRYDSDVWQSIFSPLPGATPGDTYIDRILSAGFDGVYLDVIDAFETGFAQQNIPNPQGAMVSFVARIAAYARSRHPGFVVIGQNAEVLASDPQYVATIDGIAEEETFFTEQNGLDVATATDVTRQTENNLNAFEAAGRVVWTVDYASQPADINAAYAASLSAGYIPYVTDINLDTLTLNPGHPPDRPFHHRALP
ncbi:MAG: MJ1477/TM1410 family putative glycoside hydrolase [Candidatus Xenobia bacterium]